jgi:hypothetical protein
MDLYAVLDQVLELLHQRGRVTYNALKRQFELDDACLQDLKDEIIEAQRVAVDEDGKVLVWTGDVRTPPSPATAPAVVRARPPDAEPRAYIPAHLAEKIVTARPTLAGERKQVTVWSASALAGGGRPGTHALCGAAAGAGGDTSGPDTGAGRAWPSSRPGGGSWRGQVPPGA